MNQDEICVSSLVTRLFFLGAAKNAASYEALNSTPVLDFPFASRDGSRERVQRVRTPPRDDLWLSNTTGQLVFTSGHQSVTPFLSGAALIRKILDPPLAPYISYCLFWFLFNELSGEKTFQVYLMLFFGYFARYAYWLNEQR